MGPGTTLLGSDSGTSSLLVMKRLLNAVSSGSAGKSSAGLPIAKDNSFSKYKSIEVNKTYLKEKTQKPPPAVYLSPI